MIDRSTNIRAALKSRQRGFLLNPFRFGSGVPPSAEEAVIWSATKKGTPVTIAADPTYGANLRVTTGYDGTFPGAGTSHYRNTGRFYFEFQYLGGYAFFAGIASSDQISNWDNPHLGTGTFIAVYAPLSRLDKYNLGGYTSQTGIFTIAVNDIAGFDYDHTNGNLILSKNGVSIGAIAISFLQNKKLVPFVGHPASSNTPTTNLLKARTAHLTYPVPSGATVFAEGATLF